MNNEQDAAANVIIQSSPISTTTTDMVIQEPLPTPPHPGLSMTKDAVRISSAMSAVGFDLAKRNTDFGFGMTKAFIQSANAFLHENGHVEEGTSTSSFLRATEVMVDRAHRAIGQGLSVSHDVTQSSLTMADEALTRAGIRNGELYKRIAQVVMGDEKAAEAVVAVLEVFAKFLSEDTTANNSSGSSRGSLTLLTALRPISLLLSVHQLCLKPPLPLTGNIITRSLSSPSRQSTTPDTAAASSSSSSPPITTSAPSPDLALISSMQRYYPYVIASASVGVLKLLGVIPLTMQFTSDKACIQHLTGLAEEDIVYHNLHTDSVYMSGLYIALLHDSKEIVIVFRGTSNAHDLLTDLHCSTASFEEDLTASFEDEPTASLDGSSGIDGDDGVGIDVTPQQSPQPPSQQQQPSPSPQQEQQVHAGFLRTVKSLDITLLPRILDLLHQPFPATSTSSSSSSSPSGSPLSPSSSLSLHQRGYRVTCLGYSFGAAVAGLLSLRWSSQLPSLTAFTFGPPCVASLAFARAAGQLVDVSGGRGATAVAAATTTTTTTTTTDGSITQGVRGRLLPRVVSVINGRDLVARLSLSNAEDLRDVISYLASDHQAHGSSRSSGTGAGSGGAGSIMDDIEDALTRHRTLSEDLVHLQRTYQALQRGQGWGWGRSQSQGQSRGGGNGEGNGGSSGRDDRTVGTHNTPSDIVTWEVMIAQESIQEKQLQIQAVVNELDAVYKGLILEVGHHHQHHRRAKEKLYPLGKLLYLDGESSTRQTTTSSMDGGRRGVVMGTRGLSEEGMGGGLSGLNWSGRGDEEEVGDGVGGRERTMSSSDANMNDDESRTSVGDVSDVVNGVVNGGNGSMVYEVDQLSFDHLVLSTDMLSAHLNNAYKAAIETIVTTTPSTSSP